VAVVERLQEMQKKFSHKSSISIPPHIFFAMLSSRRLRIREMNGSEYS
jgi:hypothetical protein